MQMREKGKNTNYSRKWAAEKYVKIDKAANGLPRGEESRETSARANSLQQSHKEGPNGKAPRPRAFISGFVWTR